MTREVTERDLRAKEYRDSNPEDYEFRDDGKIVRKDRFERGMRDIASIIFGPRHGYEIDDVVAAVHRLQGVRLMEVLDNARFVYEDDPKAQEVLDYIKAVLDNPKKESDGA